MKNRNRNSIGKERRGNYVNGTNLRPEANVADAETNWMDSDRKTKSNTIQSNTFSHIELIQINGYNVSHEM